MSINPPPDPNVNTFNNLYWINANDALTIGTGDLRYLKFPNAQGTENLLNTNVNGVLTCNTNAIQFTKGTGVMSVGLGGVNGGGLYSNVNIGNYVIQDTASSATGGNVAIGDGALFSLTSGDNNIAIGASNPLGFNTSGSANVALGPNALLGNVTGNYNFGLGNRALELLTSGSNNLGIGNATGSFATGNSNTCIGDITTCSNSLSFATSIGAGANCATSNTVQLGRSATDNVSIGKDIVLQTSQPTNTNGYLGYTSKVNANVSGTLTTGVLFNMTSGAGLGVINPGVYLFNINIFNNKTTSGDITNVAIGISTSATAQVGGFTAYITGHQTYTTASTDNIVNTISYVFSVPTATNYYLNQVATFTSMTLSSTTNSYCQYTRIA
jgi:hypothetical protein